MTFTFASAIKLIKAGYSVKREWWRSPVHVYLEEFEEVEPCLAVHTYEGKRQPGWLPSQCDLLADDWVRVDPKYVAAIREDDEVDEED